MRAGETREVRLFLQGGDDRVVTRGKNAAGIKLRVMGGAGNDVLDDARGGGTQLFDHQGANQVVEGPGTGFDDTPYEHPRDSRDLPQLDWGGFNFFMPTFSAGGDVGFVNGGRLQLIRYGFRKHPWASRHELQAAYAYGRRGFDLQYDGQWQHTNSRQRHRLLARASDIEIVRFYGFGNETPEQSSSFARSDQRQFLVQPSYHLGVDTVDIWVGPRLKYQETDVNQPTLLGQTRPYGVGDFGQVGANVSFAADTRPRAHGLSRGVRVAGEANYYPRAWTVDEGFGEVHGEVAAYMRLVAVRVGAKKVFGTYPFHEAAFLGGPDTVRGIARQRYAGEAALFGNAELRLPLFGFNALMPIRVGALGLADIGRVYLENESPDRWHKGVGGGVWFSFLKPENTITIAAAFDPDASGSERKTRIYMQAGFAF